MSLPRDIRYTILIEEGERLRASRPGVWDDICREFGSSSRPSVVADKALDIVEDPYRYDRPQNAVQLRMIARWLGDEDWRGLPSNRRIVRAEEVLDMLFDAHLRARVSE